MGQLYMKYLKRSLSMTLKSETFFNYKFKIIINIKNNLIKAINLHLNHSKRIWFPIEIINFKLYTVCYG